MIIRKSEQRISTIAKDIVSKKNPIIIYRTLHIFKNWKKRTTASTILPNRFSNPAHTWIHHKTYIFLSLSSASNLNTMEPL